MTKFVTWTVITFALSLAAAGVHAQSNYPVKPIRLLTPFAPGGGSDALARLIGPGLTEVFGQPIIVDNRAGGGGTLGAGLAARAEPNGYTATRHQREVGTGYFDLVREVISSGNSSTSALAESTETAQFA